MSIIRRRAVSHRRFQAAGLLVATCGLVLTGTGPAHASSTHGTEDFDFDADGLCAFTVHVAVHNDLTVTTETTANGTIEIATTVETDTVTANGVTVQGLPYHYTIRRVFDADGDQVSAIAQGEEWRFRLPDGGVWSAGGRNDFLTGVLVGSWTFDDGLGPVCDALS